MYKVILLVLMAASAFTVAGQDQLSQQKVERLYQRGRDLIIHSNYGAAREVFADFLAQASPNDSRRSEAEYYLAFSALNLGHRDGEKLIDQFIDNNPSSPKASTAYYDLATFFYGEGNYTKASGYFKKVNFPALTTNQQYEGHFKWGYSLFTQKKLDEALEQFNFVKRQSSSFSSAANYYAGFVESSKGLYSEALTDLQKAEGSPSYASIVPYLITNIYYKQKRYDTVIEYGNSVKSRKDLANGNEISMLVAEAYYFKGDFKNAVAAYQAYMEKNPKAETGLLFRAGYANYVTGNTDKGVEYLDKAAAGKDTVSYYASYYLGILYIKQGNKALAINAFDYARKNPGDKHLAEESQFQLGKTAYDAGKPDLAIAELESFLKAFPGSGHTQEVKELLAQAYVNGNNYNKAIEYIESLPSRNQYINQAFQKATYLKGSELFNKGEYPAAVVYFEKSLSNPVDPGYVALASFWNGEAYSIGARYDAAITNYTRVTGLLPNVDPELLIKTRYGLGYAYYNTKAYDKALFNFKDFIAKTTINNPNYADGLIRLADCYYVSRQYEDALSTYGKAKAASTADNDYILLQAGTIAGIQRKYQQARNHFSELIAKYPKSVYRDETMYQRAQFELEQGNYQVAIDGLTQLISEGANSKFLPLAFIRRAVAHANLKQNDRAIQDYETMIQQFPNHPEAQKALPSLQEALNAAGRSDEYDKYLTMVKNASPDKKGFETVEFESAKNFHFSQQYQKAISSFSAFLANYPGSSFAQEARFYQAESYYRLKDYTHALPLYTSLSSDRSFFLGGKVTARLAELQFQQKDYANAIGNYHKLERIAASKKDTYNAWSGLMESFYLSGAYDSSAVYARTIVERGSVDAAGQNKASLYLGKIALAKGDTEGAKDEFLNTLNTAQDEYGAEAKYLLAKIQYDQKEYKESYKTLISLNNDFSAYDQWVGKSFLLMADVFVATDDVFQARHTLQSLIDNFPLTQIKEEAKQKLRALEQSEAEKQKALEADTLDN
jgi:TolA-binding protein